MKKNKKVHDISMRIEPNMMVYKNNDAKRPVFTNTGNHQTGSSYETTVTLDIHCGSHIDRPLHMIEEGATMNSLDISRLITDCKVFDLTALTEPVIQAKDVLELDIQPDDFVLFKTRNSFHDKSQGFDYEFVFVDRSAAEVLVERRINGVGIDSLGIERSQSDHSTHKLLLGQDIIILEGLELRDIQPGQYQLIALPIHLQATEGSWVRAVLVEKVSIEE